MSRKIKHLLQSVLLTVAITAHATPSDHSYVLVAPHCLVNTLSSHYTILSQQENFLLIKTNQAGFNALLKARDQQKKPCGGFFNVTDTFSPSHNAKEFLSEYIFSYAPPKKITQHYTIHYSKEVNQLLNNLNPQDMWNNLTKLSSFSDRYAGSSTGVQAANWIKSTIEKWAKDNGRDDVTVYTVNTGNYKQPSVIAKIGTANEPGIVVGAHMDTLNAFYGNMPGADDDGSGSVTVLEAARVLLCSNMHFKKPIYLIWYSAEEMGLVGSQYVVAEFKKLNIPIENVLHFDMTGYAYKNDETLWLARDYTNLALTEYLATLIKTYVKKPIDYTQCGYACSDHATWTKNGYPAAIAFESVFEHYNPNIHTSNDKMEFLSLKHMTDYAKLSLAFTVELAEPVSVNITKME